MSTSTAAVTDYESIHRPFNGGEHYTEIALAYLQCDFPRTPKTHLRCVLEKHLGHYAPTYLYLRTGKQPGGVQWGQIRSVIHEDDGTTRPGGFGNPRCESEYFAHYRAIWDNGYTAKKIPFDVKRRYALVKGKTDEAFEAERRWVEARFPIGDGENAGLGPGANANKTDVGEHCLDIGKKPSADEKVLYAPIGPEYAIRIFGFQTLKSIQYFCFDFIDKFHRNICKPVDIRVIKEADAFGPEMEITPIEMSLENAKREPNGTPETYAILEGSMLRVLRGAREPVWIKIPIRRYQGADIVTLRSTWGFKI